MAEFSFKNQIYDSISMTFIFGPFSETFAFVPSCLRLSDFRSVPAGKTTLLNSEWFYWSLFIKMLTNDVKHHKVFIYSFSVDFNVVKIIIEICHERGFIECFKASIRGWNVLRFGSFWVNFPCETNWKVVTDCILRHKTFDYISYIRSINMVNNGRWCLCNAYGFYVGDKKKTV